MDSNGGFFLFHQTTSENSSQQQNVNTYWGGSLNHIEQPNSSLIWENKGDNFQFGDHSTTQF